jgi:2-phospho-L-lactate guanylyltransferase
MDTVAVLPIKTFSRAKHRLSAAVEPPRRRELAEAMVGDVLGALAEVGPLDELVVVTAEPHAARAAGEAGATVVHDPEEAGQSAAALRGIEAALERGAERVLLVPGDCPTLDPGEVSTLLRNAGEPPHVTVVPDRHGSGTNALVLAPPGVMAPAFGPGSRDRHTDAARAAGARLAVSALPSLGLDVDTPDDLAALRDALAARSGGAPRTRSVLARLAAHAA